METMETMETYEEILAQVNATPDGHMVEVPGWFIKRLFRQAAVSDLVEVKPYANQGGLIPVNFDDCPLFQKYGEISCEGRSGDSFCGGYLGEESRDGKTYVKCGEKS